MNIVELIEAIGMDNIEAQSLNKSVLKANTVKDETVVKFVTKSMTPTDFVLGTKIGLILWFDADKFNAAVDKVESEKAAEG
ncbi:hypothetical protein FDH89_gp15 [Pseudomonas phage phiR18]|uniref:Uncharacterized protein n=1 Tax=Pseudomonas phage phiR18 TaxID=1752027 RepID=A0A0S3UG51_9CAUD|nr:hypothetical protein FDH89_gp15 [Pseudomonas phage phiR18]BAU16343.1 hypothetical protein [Pseudomonas phage phiR18]